MSRPSAKTESAAHVVNLWDHQGRWGDNLELIWDQQRVIGHLPNRYEVKDGGEFRCRMESGKIARLRIKNVKYFPDPKDMLVFDLDPIGYLEDL